MKKGKTLLSAFGGKSFQPLIDTLKKNQYRKIAIPVFALLIINAALVSTVFAETNLVINSGFEKGTTVPFNWTFVTQNGNTPVWDSVSYSGLKSIKINIPGKTDLKSGYPESELINALPQKNYVVSAWGKTEGVGGLNTPAVRIAELDSSKNLIRQTNLPVFGEGTNDWEQKILYIQTSQNTAYFYIYANIWDGYGTFWLDDVVVSYSSLPASPLASESISTLSTILPPTLTSTPTPVPGYPGSAFYVAKNGNDNNPGTESRPWLTITKAANTLVAGETVYVKRGNYNEQVTVKNSGSPGKYITFSAYPGDTVTVDGNGRKMEDWSGLFWIKGTDFIKVVDFNLVNGRNGVDVNGGSNIIIKDN